MQLVAVAGATGYTGQRIMEQLASHPRWRGRALIRPAWADRYTAPGSQEQVICDFDDPASLAEALEGCTALIQTIGTTQGRTVPGINYTTVDFGTTLSLLAAATQAGVQRFLLLSSAGAGLGIGAYLAWKAKTEQLVRQTDRAWTIVRPTVIVGPERRTVERALLPFKPLGRVPLVSGLAPWLRAIPVEQLATCFINCLDDPSTINQTLEGPSLWAHV